MHAWKCLYMSGSVYTCVEVPIHALNCLYMRERVIIQCVNQTDIDLGLDEMYVFTTVLPVDEMPYLRGICS